MTRSNLKNSKRREAKVKLTLSTLNNDIVVLLSRMLHNRDLLSIMASCQNLFRLGLPILLERELYIRARSLQSFHKFLDFASPSSFSALRDIKFFDEDFSPAQLRIVSAILNQATELKILGITTELLVRDDTLALAVATLTRLDHLRLVGDSFIAQPLAVMTLLRSPLRRVSIACCRPWSDINSQNDDTTQIAGSDNDTDPVDLMPILAKFSTSLEHVDLCDVSFLDSTISCPRVTRLDLSPCGGPWLSALVPAFPNLNVLTADMETFYATNPKDDETLVESYNDNIAFQQQHGSWCHLKSICTELSTLYALGLQCKVDSLVINSAIRVRLSDDFDHINTLHQLLSPLQLKHLRLEDICDLTSDGMASLLSIGLQTLQRLDIYTKVSVLDKDSYQIELNAVADAISCLRIRMLEFHLSMPHYDPRNRQRGPEDEFLEGIDPETIARQIILAVSTLEYIMIGIGSTSKKQAQMFYWTVSKSDPRTLNRVSQEDAVTIRSIDGMFIPLEASDEIRTAFVY